MENNKETATTPYPMIIVPISQCCDFTASVDAQKTLCSNFPINNVYLHHEYSKNEMK